MGAIDVIRNALQSVLPTLATSDGSIEAKLIDVVGTYADSEAIERANTLNTINTALANQKNTQREYYRRISVAYQEGDSLSYDPVSQAAYYENVDESKRLVKQSYIVGAFPLFTNLVNAVDEVTGHLRKLTTEELASFDSYFAAYQPLGMDILIRTLDAAQISDDNMRIYVQAGSDFQAVLDDIKANLLAYETTLRPINVVTLSEIEALIKQTPQVVAVGWDNPSAYETLLDGTSRTVYPVLGIFELLSGVFIFATNLQVSHIQTIQ